MLRPMPALGSSAPTPSYRQIGDEAWTGVTWSGLDESNADDTIAEQIQRFGGREFEWKLYAHDRPADLGDRLVRAGFVPEDTEARGGGGRELPTDAALQDGVSVRTVTDAAGVDLMMDVHARAFGTDSSRLRRWLTELLETAPESTEMLVVMAGDAPVCSARIDFHPGTTSPVCGAAEQCGVARPRNHGRCVANRARIAAGGDRFLQVDASDDIRPILQRRFRTAGHHDPVYLRRDGGSSEVRVVPRDPTRTVSAARIAGRGATRRDGVRPGGPHRIWQQRSASAESIRRPVRLQ